MYISTISVSMTPQWTMNFCGHLEDTLADIAKRMCIKKDSWTRNTPTHWYSERSPNSTVEKKFTALTGVLVFTYAITLLHTTTTIDHRCHLTWNWLIEVDVKRDENRISFTLTQLSQSLSFRGDFGSAAWIRIVPKIICVRQLIECVVLRSILIFDMVIIKDVVGQLKRDSLCTYFKKNKYREFCIGYGIAYFILNAYITWFHRRLN